MPHLDDLVEMAPSLLDLIVILVEQNRELLGEGSEFRPQAVGLPLTAGRLKAKLQTIFIIFRASRRGIANLRGMTRDYRKLSRGCEAAISGAGGGASQNC
jgi:hypothetical protein